MSRGIKVQHKKKKPAANSRSIAIGISAAKQRNSPDSAQCSGLSQPSIYKHSPVCHCVADYNERRKAEKEAWQEENTVYRLPPRPKKRSHFAFFISECSRLTIIDKRRIGFMISWKMKMRFSSVFCRVCVVSFPNQSDILCFHFEKCVFKLMHCLVM